MRTIQVPQNISPFIDIAFVVYAELGLDFHQILQRQLLRVKGRIALR